MKQSISGQRGNLLRQSSTGKLYSTSRPYTTTQRRISRLLKEIILTQDSSPTLPDLAQWAGLSLNAAWRYINMLEQRGAIIVERRGRGRGHYMVIKVNTARGRQ